ncbi:MAG: aminotransferase [Anaerolineaceae bacterium]|nr:aminotransferase [Anaerolineaceae bacterium]|tara:strand:+ start:29260 stop:30426 length:1167 start_codon:yes stop_codon:yes gene_type:complete
MRAYKRTRDYQESVIREMTRLAIENEAINLSQGFPDFDPPEEVLQAAYEAIGSSHNQYSPTWGNLELRVKLAEQYSNKLGWSVDPEKHVTVTCGVTEAINVAMFGLLDPGDEIIIIEPAHENFIPSALLSGARPIAVPLSEENFRLDVELLKKALSDKTRAIMLNTPHNPTGRVFDVDEICSITDFVVNNNLILITDEIYDRILYDGRTHVCPGSIESLRDRTVTLGGMSKTFAMTGWRLGYIIASSKLMNAMRPVHDYLTVCAPTPLQIAAVTALNLPEDYYDDMLVDYHNRRDKLMSTLNSLGFVAQTPEGAYYVLANYSNVPSIHSNKDSRSFAVWMTKELQVAVVPGEVFYTISGYGEKTIRFAFPKRLSTLQEAADRMESYFL